MFGYACDETPELMPMPIVLAHRIMRKLTDLRKAGKMPWVRPDSKSQVTVEYDASGKPVRVDTVVVSTQHAPNVKHSTIRKEIIEKVIKTSVPAKLLDKRTVYHINPRGALWWADAGRLRRHRRKIIVDSYGGMGRHGGGAFSGKDPSVGTAARPTWRAMWQKHRGGKVGEALRSSVGLCHRLSRPGFRSRGHLWHRNGFR